MRLCSLVALALGGVLVSPALATIPTPVDNTTVTYYLGNLTVASPTSNSSYERNQFPTWEIVNGKCDTRDTVLKRDGNAVVTNSACSVESGNWYINYDNTISHKPSELHVSHIVGLEEAWVSGASSWNASQLEAFTNDLTRPQLVISTRKIMDEKGAQDPAHWMPPALQFRCTYVRAWIHVKYYYNLTIDQPEKDALKMYLGNC